MEHEEKHLDINLTPVKSGQIKAIGYHQESNTMAVQFHGRGDSEGSIYHYPNTTAKEFEAFKGAKSLGKHFGQHHKTRQFIKPVKKAA